MAEAEIALRFSFDARRWTYRERVLGASSVLILVSLFMHWFKVSVVGRPVAAVDGLSDILLWLVLVVTLGIITLLTLIAGLGRVPFAPPPGDWQLLAGSAWLNFLLVLLALLYKPGLEGQLPAGVPGTGVTVTFALGAYLAVIASSASAAASVGGLSWLLKRSYGGRHRALAGLGRSGRAASQSELARLVRRWRAASQSGLASKRDLGRLIERWRLSRRAGPRGGPPGSWNSPLGRGAGGARPSARARSSRLSSR